MSFSERSSNDPFLSARSPGARVRATLRRHEQARARARSPPGRGAGGVARGLNQDTDFSEQEDAFETYTPEMLQYCRRDVELNVKLYHYLRSEPADYGWDVCSDRSILNESAFARILGWQQQNGVGFNIDAANTLYLKLASRREEVAGKLKAYFTPWYGPTSGQTGTGLEIEEGDARYTVPKATRTMRKDRLYPATYTEGAAYTKVGLVEFNPGSRLHCGERLQKVCGWKPTEWNELGAVVDEKTLGNLDYEPVPWMIESLMLDKRLGQLAEGKQAWLKAERNGKIHGRVDPTGTRTSRCSHKQPNLGQVPTVSKEYGEECRALFQPTREGWVMVGADASGLELRMLAHRMAYFDDGAFGKTLLEGDPHIDWMKKTGIFTKPFQKNFTYSLLYGGGDEVLGRYVILDWREAFKKGLTTEKAPTMAYARDLGKARKGKLLSGLPALDMLLERCRAAYKRGWIRGLDGRVLVCKTEHGALNDLLQSDGAIVMKTAAVHFDCTIGEERREHFRYLLNVHDEIQLETEPSHADAFGLALVDSIKIAGDQLGVRVPLDAEYKVGANWSETH